MLEFTNCLLFLIASVLFWGGLVVLGYFIKLSVVEPDEPQWRVVDDYKELTSNDE